MSLITTKIIKFHSWTKKKLHHFKFSHDAKCTLTFSTLRFQIDVTINLLDRLQPHDI